MPIEILRKNRVKQEAFYLWRKMRARPDYPEWLKRRNAKIRLALMNKHKHSSPHPSHQTQHAPARHAELNLD